MLRCGFFVSSAAVETASKPTYAKKIDAAAADIPPKPKGANGSKFVAFIAGTANTTNMVNVDHGFATMSFEIPGTGDCPAAPNDPNSPDRLMSSILDWVAVNASRYDMDVTKVVVRAVSTGGYYAFRMAHTHADRLFAVVAQGGGAHHMFDPEWIAAQDRMEYSYALAEALAYKFGFRDADPEAALAAYSAEAAKFSLLNSGILDTPSCKLLAINGMEDSIFPIEYSYLVVNAGGPKDLIVRGERGHMGNPGAEDLLYDWIDGAIAGRP